MFDVATRAMVRALEGSPAEAKAALLELAGQGDGADAERERVAAALALSAHRHQVGAPTPPAWKRALHAQVARNFLLDAAAQVVARVLGEAAIPWMPIKGFDLASRVYLEREERRTSDLDILVPEEAWGTARGQLQAAGFRALAAETFHEHYLQHEGYAWQAWSPEGVLVELHFRLWGSAPASWARTLLANGTPDPQGLGPTGRRARFEDAYLIAAFHYWLDPPPRPWGPLRDLYRLLAVDPGLPARVAQEARRHQLQLPTVLASDLVARLFDRPEAEALAAELRPDLRFWERALPVDRNLSLYRLAWARLVSRRPSRLGLRSLFRAFWPHPVVVAASTPAGWPWLWRRLWYVCRRPKHPSRQVP